MICNNYSVFNESIFAIVSLVFHSNEYGKVPPITFKLIEPSLELHVVELL